MVEQFIPKEGSTDLTGLAKSNDRATPVRSNCHYCGGLIGDNSLFINGHIYHPECSPFKASPANDKHSGDFDAAGNYIPHSQMDGDLRALQAENERLRKTATDLDQLLLASRRQRKASEALVAQMREALRNMFCPRPCNGRPDDLDVGNCFDAGECGCVAHKPLAASLQSKGGKDA